MTHEKPPHLMSRLCAQMRQAVAECRKKRMARRAARETAHLDERLLRDVGLSPCIKPGRRPDSLYRFLPARELTHAQNR